jgi:hypothetical protein
VTGSGLTESGGGGPREGKEAGDMEARGRVKGGSGLPGRGQRRPELGVARFEASVASRLEFDSSWGSSYLGMI